MQALRRQFPVSEGYDEILKLWFRFASHPPSEANKIVIKFEKELSDDHEWMLALQSAKQVCVTINPLPTNDAI